MEWTSLSSQSSLPRSTLPQLPSRTTLSKSVSPKNVHGLNSDFVARPRSVLSPTSQLNSPGLHTSKKLEDLERTPNQLSPKSHSPTQTTMLVEKFKNSSTFGNILPPYHENVGGTMYFYQYSSNSENSQHTDNSLEHSSASYVEKTGMWFMSEELRNDILNRNVLSLLQADPEEYSDIPQEVDSYHELFPLENISDLALHDNHIGYQSSTYKATHMKTGTHFCLRRIHGFRLQNPKCMAFVEQWKKIMHCNIVQLKEVFTTKAFGDNSLIFVYDYYPGSETIFSKHFSSNGIGDPFVADTLTPRPYSYQKNNLLRYQQNNKLPETLIWNYIIQLTSALRIIHASTLACRNLDPTKIIISSKDWLRISCLGTMDILQYENSSSTNHIALIQHYQQEDLMALGKLVLAIACKSTTAIQRENISTALEIVSRSYSPDLRNLIMYLLTNQRRSVTDLMPMIGARFYTQLDNLHNNIDFLYNELSKELQNGRLFRLLAKLATINERPDFNMDNAWSETGDRYMLKLFRDYIFHQVTDDGHPWIDMAHIIHCLNKLDAGTPEKICLMSRDEQSILVVSFAELKHCFDQSFQEVINVGTTSQNTRNADTKLC